MFCKKRGILAGICRVDRNLAQRSVWEGTPGRRNSMGKGTEAGKLGVFRTVVQLCLVWVSKQDKAGQIGRDHMVGDTCT